MRTRLAVAVLRPRSPIADVLAVREIEELERQGQPVLAVPLPGPLVSPRVAAANLRALVRAPGRYTRLLGRLISGMIRDPAGLVRALALFPRSVDLAERLAEAGVGHLHAYSTDLPATVAGVVSALTGIGYSVTAHADDGAGPPSFRLETLRQARFVRTTSPSDRDLLRARHPRLAEETLVVAPGVSGLMALLDRASAPVPADLSRPLEGFAWDGLAAGGLGVRRVHAHADSVVVEVLVSDGRRGRDLVFKVQRAPPAGERARLEFDVLTRLSARFAGCPSYGVPRPLGLDERVAAVVMEPCRGTPLDALVREARAWPAPARRIGLESALRGTGGWLRLFQSHTAGQADGVRALDALCDRARRDLDACAGRALPRRSAARIAERLDGLAARVAGRGLRVVGRQGDFWPGNVFAGEDRVEVIDFEGYREGLPYEDPAYFLLQLELFYAYPGMRRRFAGPARAFLDGYLEGDALDRPAWELCRLAKGLQMLAQDVARGRGRGPRRWWRRHILRTQVHATRS